MPYVSPPASAIAEAAEGHVPLLMPNSKNYRVGALTKLQSYPGSYLYVMRGVSPKVIEHLKLTAQKHRRVQPPAQSPRRPQGSPTA
ncbi:MAG: hypothetical protein WDN31_21765 [Hyphomicrobium sp.]